MGLPPGEAEEQTGFEEEQTEKNDHDFQKHRREVQTSQKLDCPVQIKVRHVIKFKIEDINKHQKEHLSKSLKTALQDKEELDVEHRYYIYLPKDERHQNHLFGEEDIGTENDESFVYLCDFHREQSWDRWLSGSHNGVVQYKSSILEMFRNIALSMTEEEYVTATDALQHAFLSYYNLDAQSMTFLLLRYRIYGVQFLQNFFKDLKNFDLDQNKAAHCLRYKQGDLRKDINSKHLDFSNRKTAV
ncbi:unnamed protein product [Mytilus coruscus]|uniref:Uncharacterized protein n=1 Tax=Mytilus coruscus TaxID=42192 RepID=A0A6J8EB91_MYTCO|nr:unnamed protein product [Mytilus coruscus]